MSKTITYLLGLSVLFMTFTYSDRENPASFLKLASQSLKSEKAIGNNSAAWKSDNTSSGRATETIDIESRVKATLDENIPRSKLVVKAQDGVVAIVGTVINQKDYEIVKPLALEIAEVEHVITHINVRSTVEVDQQTLN